MPSSGSKEGTSGGRMQQLGYAVGIMLGDGFISVVNCEIVFQSPLIIMSSVPGMLLYSDLYG